MFKIILFFYLVRMIKSPSSVIFMLSYGLLVCQIDSCIHAYPSLPSIDAVSVFASCSNSYSGCLSLWELLLVCSVCQGATDVYFSMLSGSVLMGCSHSLCFRVFLLFLSSEPLLQAVQITCIMLVSTSALVLVTHILVLSIVASCIFDFHSSCRIGNFFCKMEFVACMHPVDGGATFLQIARETQAVGVEVQFFSSIWMSQRSDGGLFTHLFVLSVLWQATFAGYGQVQVPKNSIK